MGEQEKKVSIEPRALQGSPAAPGRRRAALLVLLLLAASSPAAPDASRAQTWPWPLDLPDRQLTGTFMEARSARLHSGLDLRTQGREGVVVRAPVSGRVVRVRASAKGYGKALYLRMEDGRTVVFAHLSAFADRIDRPLVEVQMRTGTYAQDLQLPDGGIAVEAGEVVALSGSTGVGAPHLHLEVRDAQSRPLNPVGLFDLPDPRRPEILGLRLHPLDAASRVEGRAATRRVEVGDSLSVYGRVGVSVRVRDRRPGNDFGLMPRFVGLRTDDGQSYNLRQDSFAFSQSGQMALEFEPDLTGNGRWLRLWRRQGNTLPGRDGAAASGLAASDDRWRAIVIVARDDAGNETRARFHLRWSEPSKAVPEPGGGELSVGIEPFGVEILARGTIRPPWVSLDSSPLKPLGEWTAAGPSTWSTGLPWSALPPRSWQLLGADGSPQTSRQSLLVGGQRTRLQWEVPEGTLVLEAAEQAAHPDGALRLEARPASEDDGCPPLTQNSWRITNHGWAPLGEVRLRWRSDATLPEGAGWILREEEDDCIWLASGREGGGPTLETDALDEGTLALVVDREAPRLGSLRSRGRSLGGALRSRSESERIVAPGLRLSRWPAVDVSLRDACSGVDEADLYGEVDGRPWPLRYDPESETVSFDFPVELVGGEHVLLVRVRDRAGNLGERRWTLRFEDSPAAD